MLREIQGVIPSADGHPRRWFTSDFFDLFLFYRHKQIESFQLCYDKTGAEHALHWMGGRSFRHCCVDTGDSMPFRNESPVLDAPRKPFDGMIVSRFTNDSMGIDPRVRVVVLQKLDEYLKDLKKRMSEDYF